MALKQKRSTATAPSYKNNDYNKKSIRYTRVL